MSDWLHPNHQVMLSTINLSKSAFGMVKLEDKSFFTTYKCPDPTNHRSVIVRCKMQIRVYFVFAELSNCSSFWAFSKRVTLRHGKIKIPVRSHVKLRLSITHRTEHVDLLFDFCVNTVSTYRRFEFTKGVVKTHQLTYSPAPTFYAVYNREECNQHFVIQSKVAKEYLDHFQSRIEEVDMYVDDGKLIWNGYTEGFIGDDNRMSTTLQHW